MGKRLINLETGEPIQYTEGETFYSDKFYELVEGELTDEMVHNLIQEDIDKNIIDDINTIN